MKVCETILIILIGLTNLLPDFIDYIIKSMVLCRIKRLIMLYYGYLPWIRGRRIVRKLLIINKITSKPEQS